MEGKQRAELKNQVLEFLLNKEGSYSNDYIYSEMGEPTISQAHFDELLKEMKNEAVRYFVYNDRRGYIFAGSNSFTNEFLVKGGFVNMYESELEADLQAVSIQNQEREIRDLQQENLILSNQVAAMKIKTYWLPIIISAISAVVAVGSLIYAINSNSNSVSRSELETIQNNMDSLRSDFLKENDELKEKLFKAEMWISVLEEEPSK